MKRQGTETYCGRLICLRRRFRTATTHESRIGILAEKKNSGNQCPTEQKKKGRSEIQRLEQIQRTRRITTKNDVRRASDYSVEIVDQRWTCTRLDNRIELSILRSEWRTHLWTKIDEDVRFLLKGTEEVCSICSSSTVYRSDAFRWFLCWSFLWISIDEENQSRNYSSRTNCLRHVICIHRLVHWDNREPLHRRERHAVLYNHQDQRDEKGRRALLTLLSMLWSRRRYSSSWIASYRHRPVYDWFSPLHRYSEGNERIFSSAHQSRSWLTPLAIVPKRNGGFVERGLESSKRKTTMIKRNTFVSRFTRGSVIPVRSK